MNGTDSASIARGRWTVVFVISLVALGELYFTVRMVQTVGIDFFHLTRLGLTGGLIYAMWRGQQWARWVLVGLAGLAMAIMLAPMLKTPLAAALLIHFWLTFTLLAFPAGVSTFLKNQAAQRGLEEKSATDVQTSE